MEAIGNDKPALRPGDLPAWLTALQAVAWVMTRDTQIVAWANPIKPLQSYRSAEFLRPSSAVVKVTNVDVMGISATLKMPSGALVPVKILSTGINAFWLNIHCRQPATADADYPIRDTAAAMEEITKALRTGTISARAKQEGGVLVDMGSDEWVDRVIGRIGRDDRDGRILEALKVRSGADPWYDWVWSGLRLPRDRLLELWPPNSAGDAPVPAQQSSARSELEPGKSADIPQKGAPGRRINTRKKIPQDKANEWMLQLAKQTKGYLYRNDGITRCQKDLNCQRPIARTAYTSLPTELKVQRGKPAR